MPASSIDTVEADAEQEDFCWICFHGPRPGQPLERVCRCPTLVHKQCVAMWQLYSAGRKEEKCCRFCEDTLPDWKAVLRPSAPLSAASPVVLSVYYNNTRYRVELVPGPKGIRAFWRQLQELTGDEFDRLHFVFRCVCPVSGAEIVLKGIQAFEAALHCACVRAAQRMAAAQARAGSAVTTPFPPGALAAMTSLSEPQQNVQRQASGIRAPLPSPGAAVSVATAVAPGDLEPLASAGSSTLLAPLRPLAPTPAAACTSVPQPHPTCTVVSGDGSRATSSCGAARPAVASPSPFRTAFQGGLPPLAAEPAPDVQASRASSSEVLTAASCSALPNIAAAAHASITQSALMARALSESQSRPTAAPVSTLPLASAAPPPPLGRPAGAAPVAQQSQAAGRVALPAAQQPPAQQQHTGGIGGLKNKLAMMSSACFHAAFPSGSFRAGH